MINKISKPARNSSRAGYFIIYLLSAYLLKYETFPDWDLRYRAIIWMQEQYRIQKLFA